MQDVVVVGGGHNGLVAAILLAGAGRRVTLVERSPALGGATVSDRLFDGHPARLSRYSYLVSLFPAELATRLGIDLRLVSRPVSSYTPVVRRGRPTGLLVERRPGTATERSFAELTGSGADFRAWQRFYAEIGALARVVAPVLTGPLRRRSEVRDAVTAIGGRRIWDELMEQPIGTSICDRFGDDTVRGVVATDALIGTFSSLFDESLTANRCFLFHVIGRGTGEWLVPRGGMGAITAQLSLRAEESGVTVLTSTTVVQAAEDAHGVDLHCLTPAGESVLRAPVVIAAVAPTVVAGWFGGQPTAPVGAQLKVNLLLDRLPALASGADPAVAFAGTTHLDEGFDRLEEAYREAAGGAVPSPLPAESYCHSLTDASVLAGGRGATLTVFGLHTPATLFGPGGSREQAVAATLAAVERHLAEPLADCIATDVHGRPCVDAADPTDLETALGMPGGHIFHGDLDWPWLADDEPADEPAQRWGVAVPGSRRVLLAGAGSRRGGGVSGLGGAAAADACVSIPWHRVGLSPVPDRS